MVVVLGTYVASSWFHREVTWIQVGIGIIAGAVITLFGVALARRWLPSKILSWQVIADERLVRTRQTGQSNPGDLSVRWQGQLVVDPRLITIRITNTGRREVTEVDFNERPITVKVIGCRFLAAPSVAGASSEMVRSGASSWNAAVPEGDAINLPAVLFNAGDWIELSLFVDGGGEVAAHGRFAGETRPMSYLDLAADRERLRRRTMIFGVSAAFLGGLVATTLIHIDISPSNTSQIATGVVAPPRCCWARRLSSHEYFRKSTRWSLVPDLASHE